MTSFKSRKVIFYIILYVYNCLKNKKLQLNFGSLDPNSDPNCIDFHIQSLISELYKK